MKKQEEDIAEKATTSISKDQEAIIEQQIEEELV
jgi:hypothetical protein